ncbi:DUF2339 domain-containing protein [Labedaea rhizosphaerae]|nr:DUF2339 domain-containing protein [Labedaea rhizosphaerae]
MGAPMGQQWGAPPPQLFPPAGPPLGPTLWQRLSKDGAGSRILAWVGGAVTLLGVVLLLVLAIQRGYLGPLSRVLLGAALGVGLAGTGMRLHRTPANRIGALAVAATGFAVVYLDLVAATTLYHYLPSWLGLLAGLLVAGAGLLLAGRWDAELFAVFVVVGCAVCAPVLTGGFKPLLLGFLLVLMTATSPVLLRRRWPGLALAAGVPPVVASTVTILVARTATHPDTPKTTAAMLGVATTALVIALATAAAARQPDGDQLPGLLVGAVVPGLLAATLVPRLPAAGLAIVVCGFLLVVWLVDRSGLLELPRRFVTVAGAGSALALFQATMLAAQGRGLAPVLLGEALLFGLLAWRSRGTGVLVASAGFGLAGLLAALVHGLPIVYLLQPPRYAPPLGTLATAAGTGLLLTAVVAVLLVAATKAGVLPGPDHQPGPWLTGAAIGLYGASGAVLTVGLLIAPDRAGFLGGHVLVTISWTVTALVLLLRGIDHLPLRVTGLVLTGAALAKLVLFDLASLDGLARVAAFLGAGLVLLAAGTRYARLVAGRH